MNTLYGIFGFLVLALFVTFIFIITAKEIIKKEGFDEARSLLTIRFYKLDQEIDLLENPRVTDIISIVLLRPDKSIYTVNSMLNDVNLRQFFYERVSPK